MPAGWDGCSTAGRFRNQGAARVANVPYPRRMVDILGVDVGGTFTDFYYLDNGEVRVAKFPSTPAKQLGSISFTALR